MSLFVCMNPSCQCVENTSLVSRSIHTNDDYPNMHLMDMQGQSGAEEEFYIGAIIDDVNKYPGEVLMLCSKCNTSIWHGEFPKEKASEELLKLASISKFNAITPMDHPEGSIVKNENSEWGNVDEYRLATAEEMASYVNKRRKSKSTLSKLFGVATMLGIDLPNLTSSNKIGQELSEKKIKMAYAEYKRQWKQAKKDKDLDRVKKLKEKMDELK